MKDESCKYFILGYILNISGSTKAFFSWPTLKSLNLHYLVNYSDIVVRQKYKKKNVL
jgi:hypothetical protein